MGQRAHPMPKLFLASCIRTIICKKREVGKCTTKFKINYYNKFNLQEHWKASPSLPLEINYTQQNL